LDDNFPKNGGAEMLGKSGEHVINVIALVVAILAIVTTAWLARDKFLPGKVIPLWPTGFAIIREMPQYGFPSDHLVLPIDWMNTSVYTKVVRNPYIVLKEVDTNGDEIGQELEFLLAGEYPAISGHTFEELYTSGGSFIVEPRSALTTVLVFNIKGWWDENGDFYNFRFSTGKNYNVYIGFHEGAKLQTEQMFLRLPIYETVGDLDRKTGYWWSYFSSNIS
jgi:hypothetical protein